MTHTTEQLIARLAKAPLPRPLALGRMTLLVMTMTALGVGVWIALMGTRPDLGNAIFQPVVAAKTVLPAVVASLALALATRSARPGRRVPLFVLTAPIPFATVLFLSAIMATPAPVIAEAIIGSTAVKCLTAIVGLSILPIVGGLFFLKDGASTRPATTGALLGLAAGAGAASGYSLACTEDSPLFYVVWYGLAICAAGGIGAVVGNRYLKW